MHMNDSKQILLKLLQYAAGNGHGTLPSGFDNWKEVFNLANEQGVAAVAVDGLSKYYEQGGAPLSLDKAKFEKVKFEWYGTLCQSEEKYSEYEGKISQLAAYFEGIGMKMMVLKGYGVGQDWPIPNHRPVGDIDIWLFGKQKEADMSIERDLGLKVDNSHHHHTIFFYKGLMVENHYDFIPPNRPSSIKIEKRLKKLAEDFIPAEIKNICLPTSEFNALFLLHHSAGHFSSVCINMRQVLDWLFFVRAHHKEIDWNSLYEILREENIDHFANSLNAIGVKYLGFEPSIFHEIEKDSALVDRIIEDILEPEFKEQEDGTLFKGLWVKPRRWWHNRWKHKICYSDNLFLSFIFGFCSKLLKPKRFTI